MGICVFLASGSADFVNGTTIETDGGMLPGVLYEASATNCSSNWFSSSSSPIGQNNSDIMTGMIHCAAV
jgi:hypothetical protein